MNIEMVTRTIQLIVAPVVMISTCGLMLNSLVVRYNAANERVRALTRERLDLLRQMAAAELDGDHAGRRAGHCA